MAEIESFLSKDAEKQVKDLVKLMGGLAKSYEQAFKSSKKLDEQITKTSKTTQKQKEQKKELTAIQKEEARILKATEATKAKLAIIEGKSGKLLELENKLLTKNQELLKSKNKELRAETNETGRLAGAFRKLNNRRTEAAKRLKDLIASERASTREIQKAQRAFDGLDKKVQKANRSARQFQSNVGNYPQLLRASTSALRGFVGAFGLVGGIALFASTVRDAFRIIREFDKQIIAVQKTTNLTNPEIKLFKKEVIALGLALKGVSIQGLLKASEVAGQLGVKGRENILKFAEVIEKLKLTSDIAGEESVRAFAKFIEISIDTVANADRLGSVITELGNNFATSESQILKNTIEIQKGIAIYDANAASVIGLGAATNALGSEAEQARSALQTTFKVLNEGASSGKNLGRILKLTGQTAAEFREEFGTDSVKVFQRFVKGLSESVDEGKNLSNTLSELGLEQKRTEAVIGVLAKNYNVLEDALNRANKEYKENSALNREAALSAKSLDSIISDVSDSWAGLITIIEDGDNAIASFIKGSLARLESGFKALGRVISGTSLEFELWQERIISASLDTGELGKRANNLADKISLLTTESEKWFITDQKRHFIQQAIIKVEKERAFILDLLKKKIKETADAEVEAVEDVGEAVEDEVKRLDNLIQRQIDLAIPIAEANAELATMRDIAKDTTKSDVERNQALERAKELQIELIGWARELRGLNIEKLELELQVENTLENALKLEQARANAIKQTASEERIFLSLLREQNKLQGQDVSFLKTQRDQIVELNDELVEGTKDANTDLISFVEKGIDFLLQKKKDANAEEIEDEKKKEEQKQAIIAASAQLLTDIAQGFTDTRIQQLSDESNALELQRQTRLENVAGDKAKEAQVNAEFDKKQAVIKQKQFKEEQKGALFRIAIQTGVNIVKVFPNPVLIALALALGLANAAFVKAQKPPKFGKGSKGLQKDTYGEVGEAGRELLFMPGGGVALAEKSTKAMLPKGTVIKTNRETEQILAANQLRASRENDTAMRDYSELTLLGNSIAEDRKSILKAVNDRDQYIFQVSKEGVKALMKNSRGMTTYLDTRFR